jgi:magnesium transporter
MDTDRVSVRLYDGRGAGEAVELGDNRIGKRDQDKLLWIDLVSADGRGIEQSAKAIGIEVEKLQRLLESGDGGSVDDEGESIAVHAFTLDRHGDEYEREPLDLAAGSNWVVTAHERDNRTIEDFQQRLETSRQVGELDGGSFVAFLLDWLFTRYMVAIEEVDSEIDELDISILRSSGGGASLERITDLRRRVARIRRALAAHREVVTWPAHTEFSDVMTDRAQRHFAVVAERFEQAMISADATRDSLAGSFDLLMSRVAQRTNDTVRVLTVVSVSLLPATLVTGVMGMNFHPAFFDQPSYFWFTLAAITVVVAAVLITAHKRHWV